FCFSCLKSHSNLPAELTGCVRRTCRKHQPGGPMRTTAESVLFKSRMWRLLPLVAVITGALNWGNLMAAANSAPPPCDKVPTGVSTSDYFLDFKVPDGLMPDPQFNGQPAKLQVHRVQPVYANGKCPGGPTRAAVLIHGRTRPGPVAFDLRQSAPGG